MNPQERWKRAKVRQVALPFLFLVMGAIAWSMMSCRAEAGGCQTYVSSSSFAPREGLLQRIARRCLERRIDRQNRILSRSSHCAPRQQSSVLEFRDQIEITPEPPQATQDQIIEIPREPIRLRIRSKPIAVETTTRSKAVFPLCRP